MGRNGGNQETRRVHGWQNHRQPRWTRCRPRQERRIARTGDRSYCFLSVRPSVLPRRARERAQNARRDAGVWPHPIWPTSRPTSSSTSLLRAPRVFFRLSSSAADPPWSGGGPPPPGACVSVNARDSSSRLLGSILRAPRRPVPGDIKNESILTTRNECATAGNERDNWESKYNNWEQRLQCVPKPGLPTPAPGHSSGSRAVWCGDPHERPYPRAHERHYPRAPGRQQHSKLLDLLQRWNERVWQSEDAERDISLLLEAGGRGEEGEGWHWRQPSRNGRTC